ncbi:MAG: hypothetical protein EA402_07265 [Planctomycetota bacterium]|nr:MAG: hypothetical protein EA402_07265 [Planctomycetota bacterium]
MAEPHLPHPAPLPGFVRLAVLLDQPATPGQIASACGVDLDHLGPIVVDHGQALVDIREEMAPEARERLKSIGATQLQTRAPVPPARWRWLRLAVGRNHGMTIGQFKRIMSRSPAGQLGRIHLNNTHTLVGIREDYFAAVCDHFSEAKINGIAVRPGDPQPGETFDSPMYTGKDSA